jgi:hypothetical protein
MNHRFFENSIRTQSPDLSIKTPYFMYSPAVFPTFPSIIERVTVLYNVHEDLPQEEIIATMPAICYKINSKVMLELTKLLYI